MAFRTIPVMVPVQARVVRARVPIVGSRWLGGLIVGLEGSVRVDLLMPGSIARWFQPGESVKVRFLERFRELAAPYGSRRIVRTAVGEEIAEEALRKS